MLICECTDTQRRRGGERERDRVSDRESGKEIDK
jgi:hypothetical protein